MSWKVSFLVSRTARETSLLSSTDLRQAVAYRDFGYRGQRPELTTSQRGARPNERNHSRCFSVSLA